VINSGRSEKRFPRSLPVRLWSPLNPAYAGKTTTENVSGHGLRIRVKRAFQRREILLIAFESGEFQTQALVVYCQPLSDGLFAVGLRCETSWDWDNDVPRIRAA